MPGHIHAAAAATTLAPAAVRLGRGSVGAAVVDHDALADQVPGHFPNDSGNILRLIQCGNHNRNRLQGPNQRLQRSPQLEQAGGGCGLSSARRNSWYFSPFQISRMVCCVALPKVKLS